MDYVSQLSLFFQLHFTSSQPSFIFNRLLLLIHNVQSHSIRFESDFRRFRSDGPCDQPREDRNESFIGELGFPLVTDQ